MRICLIDDRSAGETSNPGAGYVAELGPALAQDHKVSILTIQPGPLHLPGTTQRLRRLLNSDHPEIVHINHLSGLTLAAVLGTLGAGSPTFMPAIALGVHDDSWLRHGTAFNRRITQSVSLVVSPSAALLDRHLARGFFPEAIPAVIPYDMPYHAERLTEAYRRLLIARRTGELGRAA